MKINNKLKKEVEQRESVEFYDKGFRYEYGG